MSPHLRRRCRLAPLVVAALLGARDAFAQDSAPRQSALTRPAADVALAFRRRGNRAVRARDRRPPRRRGMGHGAARLGLRATGARARRGRDAAHGRPRRRHRATRSTSRCGCTTARPDSIVGTLARRDYVGYSDWAHVIVDSRHDRRTAFRFAVNPSGVKRDGFIMATPSGPRITRGTRCGTRPPAATPPAGRPSSAFRSRSCASPRRAKPARSGESSSSATSRGAPSGRSGRPFPPSSGQFVSLFGTLAGVRTASVQAAAGARRRTRWRARGARTPIRPIRSAT